MSRRRKALERIGATPPPSDLTWKELRSTLERLGYEMLSGSGARRKFWHEGRKALIICHEPHPDPHVDKACITEIREHLTQYGFTKEY
jgi:hypothetical protein